MPAALFPRGLWDYNLGVDYSTITELYRHRALLARMTARDFKGRYAGSLMGVFWTVITPLLLLAVFTFIFAVVFKARFGGRAELGVSALYILCGILPWLAFQEGLSRAGTVALENKNLVTRAMFPLSVLPCYPALAAMLGQMAGFFILGMLSSATIGPPGPSLILLPLIIAIQLVLTAGLAALACALSVYVRDVVHALPVLLLVWFYGTPVFYPADMVPDKFRFLIALNPVAHLVEAYRAVILEGAWPDPANMGAALGYALLAAAIGFAAFGKLSPGFADRL